MQKKMIVVTVTHNGVFHADDALAMAIIKMMAVIWMMQVEIIRTRDPEVIATADIVFDVGGVYDPEKGRFDHHQRGCEAAWKDGTRLSSAGMVWLKHGLELVKDKCRFEDMTEAEKHEVWEEVYKTCLMHVDNLDNGQGDLTKKTLSDATLSAAIADFNCGGNASEEDHFLAFQDAVAFASGVLSRRIWQCMEDVKQRMSLRSQHVGDVVVLDAPMDAVIVAEALPQAKLIIMPQFGQWMVVCVPPSREERFSQRLPFPESFAGLRGPALAGVLAKGPAQDEAAADEAGAACFVHGVRFCGGMRSQEAALDLAQQVLKG